MSVRRSRDGLWLPLTPEAVPAEALEWPPARAGTEARDEARRRAGAPLLRSSAVASADADADAPASLWGPPAPPQFAAALRARLVEAALGGRLARGFCSKVVGMGVERSVESSKR